MQSIRQPIVLDVPWLVCVCVFVCLLGPTVGCAKTAEPIEMPFGCGHIGSKEP